MFSFGSSEIKIAYSYLAVVIRLQPSVLNSEHNVDFFFFLVMQKFWIMSALSTHNKMKQPNTWNVHDESLKQTFRNILFFWNCTELKSHTLM